MIKNDNEKNVRTLEWKIQRSSKPKRDFWNERIYRRRSNSRIVKSNTQEGIARMVTIINDGKVVEKIIRKRRSLVGTLESNGTQQPEGQIGEWTQ